MRVIFLFLFLCSLQYSFSQSVEYKINSQKGDSLFLIQEYTEAINFYQKAFSSNNDIGTVLHRYRIASCYAILKMNDSSFHHLYRISEKGKFSQIELLSNDYNFKNLYSDKRWSDVLKIVDKNRKDKEKKEIRE
ncbi:MAG: hypothetical protein K2Q24_18275 [Chitinophagaceae bacterium]|jgi:tetratricopeptide (TPR) repeat protein|nr:hypothetical protein [Chitinophagaceae bacterium]